MNGTFIFLTKTLKLCEFPGQEKKEGKKKQENVSVTVNSTCLLTQWDKGCQQQHINLVTV